MPVQLPKKIMPDRLKDAIVEIHYEYSLPFEVFLGIIFQNLDDNFIYTNAPLDINKNQFESVYKKTNLSVFYNDRIKVLCRPKSFIFNFLSSYIGWSAYEGEIYGFLSQILKPQLDGFKFNRTSVRYISEYENVSLDKCFKFKFTFGMPNVQSDVFTFRSEFSQNNLSIFLNLQNRIRIINEKDGQSDSISVVDIDVLDNNFETDKLDDLMKIISRVHEKQKEVFFSIITDEFLKTLKPEY